MNIIVALVIIRKAANGRWRIKSVKDLTLLAKQILFAAWRLHVHGSLIEGAWRRRVLRHHVRNWRLAVIRLEQTLHCSVHVVLGAVELWLWLHWSRVRVHQICLIVLMMDVGLLIVVVVWDLLKAEIHNSN